VTALVSLWRDAETRAQLDGIEILRTGSRNTYSVAAPAFHHRALRERAFDIVVEDLNKVPLFTPWWQKRPLVLLVHHLFGATAFQEASLPFAAATWLLERPLAQVYRGTPVQAVSRSTADDLVQRGFPAEDIVVISNGVDLEFLAPDPAEPRFEQPTALYVGRLKRYKRVDLILAAVARLKGQDRQLRLLIAGRGDAEEALRARVAELGIHDRVEFLGFVSEQEKRSLLRKTWVHVFTSPKEGWGMSNLEAAACGTPTVASDSPGLRDSVAHGHTGFLVPHGDVDVLAERIRSVIEQPDLRATLGVGARRFALEHGWDRSADRTEAHLEEVLVNRGMVPRSGADRPTRA
jgi:glycosyltransferase involved in cell wall biosynthesis